MNNQKVYDIQTFINENRLYLLALIIGFYVMSRLVTIISIIASFEQISDGKGYPEGLKEEQIPFCAQVAGIADVYDALIEKRVYKEPFSHERAIEMILNGECGKFSDKIINCLRLVEEEFNVISKIES